MVGERSIFPFVICIILFSLNVPTVSNRKPCIVSHESIPTECDSMSFQQVTDQFISHFRKSNHSMLINEAFGEEPEARSSYVIMTLVNFTKKIYTNENEIIETQQTIHLSIGMEKIIKL